MADSALFARYFDETAPELWPLETQRSAVTGHASVGTYEFMGRVRAPSYLDPTAGGDCAGFDWTYDPETNPDGARCTIQDYQVAVWGRRPQDGFANRAYDNVGVQYGLSALESGLILPEQFVDLNERIGGWDIDKVWQPGRSEADPPALPIAYRSGRVTNGRELAKVPIIDLRGSSNFEEHYDWRTHVLRARLLRDNGHADNHVAWNSPCPLLPCPPMAEQAFLLMDRWLAAIEADTSSDPLAVKVVRNKPAAAVDACWIDGQKITDQSLCGVLLPYFRDPRFVAGGPATFDVLKCQLKPLDRTDYTTTFSDDQWARLERAFPSGVCDYRKPGVAQQPPSGPWQTFAEGPGGQPLEPAPTSTAVAK